MPEYLFSDPLGQKYVFFYIQYIFGLLIIEPDCQA